MNQRNVEVNLRFCFNLWSIWFTVYLNMFYSAHHSFSDLFFSSFCFGVLVCQSCNPSHLLSGIPPRRPNSCLFLPWIWMCLTPVQQLYNNCKTQTCPDVQPITLCQLYYTLSGIPWKMYYSGVYDRTQLTPCSRWHPAKKKTLTSSAAPTLTVPPTWSPEGHKPHVHKAH